MIPKAHRWVGEMEEIARTFEDCGLTAQDLSGRCRDLRFRGADGARQDHAGAVAGRGPLVRGGRRRAGRRALARMPELPDVELYRRTLDDHALHQEILRAVVSDARILGDLAEKDFVGAPEGQPAGALAPARQASAGATRPRRLADHAFRHDRRAWSYVEPAGRGRALRPGAARVQGRQPRLRQPAHARPGRSRRRCRRLHRGGRAGARRARSGVRSRDALGGAGRPARGQGRAHGPERGRRHRQPLCRRDPVPGPPAPEDAGPDARQGKAQVAVRARSRRSCRPRSTAAPAPSSFSSACRRAGCCRSATRAGAVRVAAESSRP